MTKTGIRFVGLLRGAGKESNCIGWCTKVTLQKGGLAADVAFVDYRIYDNEVLPRLPDGMYELFAHGRSTLVSRVNGLWLIA